MFERPSQALLHIRLLVGDHFPEFKLYGGDVGACKELVLYWNVSSSGVVAAVYCGIINHSGKADFRDLQYCGGMSVVLKTPGKNGKFLIVLRHDGLKDIDKKWAELCENGRGSSRRRSLGEVDDYEYQEKEVDALETGWLFQSWEKYLIKKIELIKMAISHRAPCFCTGTLLPTQAHGAAKQLYEGDLLMICNRCGRIEDEVAPGEFLDSYSSFMHYERKKRRGV